MLDLSHYWGNDLDVSPTGDLAIADRTTTGEQRVYRRLLTNPALSDRTGEPIGVADYAFNPGYGGGVGRYVGQPARTGEVASLIHSQMAKERAVARSPTAIVDIESAGNVLAAVIRYVDSDSKQPVTISFEVNS